MHDFKTKYEEVVFIAKQLLRNEGDFLRSIIRMARLRDSVGLENDYDKDFAIFFVIDDATCHMPSGEQRQRFSSEWLSKCDAELEIIKVAHKKELEWACNNIIGRYG